MCEFSLCEVGTNGKKFLGKLRPFIPSVPNGEVDVLFIYTFTWHKVKQESRDGIKRRAVSNVRASVSQDRHNPVGDAPAFPRQVVRQAMSAVHERW